MSPQPRPRLDLYTPDGELEAAVGPGAGLAFVKYCFPEASQTLLIATAYFSIKGYDLARPHIPASTRINILVGKRDGPHVQKAVQEEIERELRSVEYKDLYVAVEDLLERLRSGRFRIADARQMIIQFHCKFYICHETLAWQGSSNFSINGLKGQAEQAQVIHDPTLIKRWRKWFYEVASSALALQSELIEVLENWLGMADPFEIYLKALLRLLNDIPELQREGYAHTPVYYQRHLAVWALHQLNTHGGALLVVATGLGKTVIGAEIAGLLRLADEIGRVVLLAPKAVHHLWEEQLDGRVVPFNMFDNSVLFKKETEKDHHQITKLVALLQKADDRTLIVVDEVHMYRNQLLAHRSNKRSRVVSRIVRATGQGARVVLMTGSAYGTNIQNLNSLLYLLPHRGPGALDRRSPWQVESHSSFHLLPPVAVLGYPHVIKMAHQRGDVEDGHPFVEFGAKRHYFPTTFQSRLVPYELPLQASVANAFAARCFDQAKKIPTRTYDDNKGEITTMTDTVFNVTLNGWLSSPGALLEDIAKNLKTSGKVETLSLFGDSEELPDDVLRDLWGQPIPLRKKTTSSSNGTSGYDTTLRLSDSTRLSHLHSLQDELQPLRYKPDDKAKKLIEVFRKHREDGYLKAIIFVERLATALYLERVLHKQMRSLHVACTVRKSGELKPLHEREYLLKCFSPRSQGYTGGDKSFDVLICTDADGVGVNLQDANAVINYDLTSGVDRLVQRLGRVLRATPERDRELYVYTFIPIIIQQPAPTDGVYQYIRARYARLFARHEKSSAILGSRILAANGSTTAISLDGEVETASLLTIANLPSRENDEQTIAAHLGILEQHRQKAEGLPHTLHSARYFDGSEHRLVVILSYDGKYHSLVINPKNQEVVSEDIITALNLLACSPDEPRVGVLSVRVSHILETANEAARRWCIRTQVNLDDVERLAALYLMPSHSSASDT